LPCAVGKGNTRHRSLSCATCDKRQSKGVDGRPRRDGVGRSLPCATHKYSRHIKMKKEQGRATTTPVAGRRSFVPHASDATTTTPLQLLPASTAARAHYSTTNPPLRRAPPPLMPPLDPTQKRSERQRTPHEEGGRTAGHTPVGKEADGARCRRSHENSSAFSTPFSVPPCSHRLWGPEEASAHRPQRRGPPDPRRWASARRPSGEEAAPGCVMTHPPGCVMTNNVERP
jgi:hypothetical protein